MKRTLAPLVIAVAMLSALLAGFAPSAAAQDSGADAGAPSLLGVGVEIVNTIEAPAFGFEGENPFGEQGLRAINSTVEFPACCDGFYEVNVTADQISMQWIGPADFERVLEPTTFDRYYFTFTEPVLAGASMNAASSMGEVVVTSPTTMTVTVGPGSDLTGPAFMLIDVDVAGSAPAQLAFTGAETTVLAIAGAAAVVAGGGLVRWSRRLQRDGV